MEGSIRTGHKNVCHHAIEIVENIAGGNPKRRKTDLAQSGVPSEITLRSVAHCMDLAIDLDCQAALEAGEINHIAFARELATEP